MKAKSTPKKTNKVLAKATGKKKVKAKVKTQLKTRPKSKETTKPKATTQLRTQAALPAAKGNRIMSARKLEKIQPLGDRLFIEVQDHREKRTAGGLYIPDTVDTKDSYYEGIVLAVGTGRRGKRGKLVPMDVSVGDKVLFASYAGTSVEMNQKNYFFVNEDQVIGIKKS
jgi:chaperonin GroES